MKFCYLSLLLGLFSLVAVGCDGGPRAKKTDVDVKVGGGEGVKVDVDTDRPLLQPKKDTDVKVDLPGVKVDVD